MMVAERETRRGRAARRGYADRLRRSEAGREAGRVKLEALLQLARFLPEEDRLLFETHVQGRLTAGQIAGLQGRRPYRVRRRLQAIQGRLQSPAFALTALLGGRLPAELAVLARAHFVEGLSQRRCAARFGRTLHQVRGQLEGIRVLLKVAPRSPELWGEMEDA